jgi:hypothetical protein
MFFSIATYFLKGFGMLFVTSKAISEFAYFDSYKTLELVRDAIERAMHISDRDDDIIDHMSEAESDSL